MLLFFCLWLIAVHVVADGDVAVADGDVADGDADLVSLFTHLSEVAGNSSCTVVSLTRTRECSTLAAHTTLTAGELWCHRPAPNETDQVAATHKDKNLVCTLEEAERVMFVTVPCDECWLYRVYPTVPSIVKTRRFRPYNYSRTAFSSSQQRLYFCSYSDMLHIMSSDLDGTNERIHVHKVYCNDLAVDDLNSLVFFVGVLSSTEMTSRLNDEGYEIVRRLSWRPYCISAHPGTRMLFIGGSDKIMSFDYEGKHRKYIGRERDQVYSLAVNPRGDVLYYGTTRILYAISLKDVVKSVVLFCKFLGGRRGMAGIKYMTYAYNRVIFSSTLHPYVIIFDPETTNFTTFPMENTYRVLFFIVRECT